MTPPVTTTLVSHPACLGHLTPPGHPERPERLQAVLEALEGDSFRALKRERAPRARRGALARVHSRAYINALLGHMPERGFAMVDSDTAISPGSREAALRAAGAVVRAVDLVMAGQTRNAFCAVRPPGHHAEAGRAMGFCLFNNVAVGAAHVRAAHGVRRIAVFDFDVHHGNGTETIFADDADFLYASTHQSPLFPGTGRQSAEDTVLNMPLEPGAGSADFRAAFRKALDRAADFQPEFVFISAGFDAHRDDTMAQLKLDERDFAWATEEVCDLAGQLSGGRVVSTLEGGYDLPSLARSARAHVEALMAS